MLRSLCKAIHHLVITNIVAANGLNTSGLPAPFDQLDLSGRPANPGTPHRGSRVIPSRCRLAHATDRAFSCSPDDICTFSASRVLHRCLRQVAEFVGFLTRILVYIERSLTIGPATGIPRLNLTRKNHGKHKDIRSDQTRSDLAFK